MRDPVKLIAAICALLLVEGCRAGVSGDKDDTETDTDTDFWTQDTQAGTDPETVVETLDGELQASIDLSNCLAGDLRITDETDLDALSQYTCVEGVLDIQTVDMGTFDGLGNITYVGGNLTITYNNHMTRFVGLNGLVFVGGHLNVWHNPELVVFDGFEALRTVHGRISVASNDALLELDTFSSVEDCHYVTIHMNASLLRVGGFDELWNLSASNGYYYRGDVDIRDNHSLEEIAGFPKLQRAEGVTIEYNPALQRISGFTDLRYVSFEGVRIAEGAAGLIIDGLQSLVSVDRFTITGTGIKHLLGFYALKEVTGGVRIIDNQFLRTLNSFANLKRIEENLIIWNSPHLGAIQGFESLVKVEGILDIYLNHTLVSPGTFVSLEEVGTLGVHSNFGLVGISDGFPKLAVAEAVKVRNNSKLPSCDICTLLGALGMPAQESDVLFNSVDTCMAEDALVCP